MTVNLLVLSHLVATSRQDNIKIDVRVIGLEDGRWIDLAHNGDCQAGCGISCVEIQASATRELGTKATVRAQSVSDPLSLNAHVFNPAAINF